MPVEILMADENYSGVKKEPDWLHTALCREIAEKIRADGYSGDLSENSGDDPARNAQVVAESEVTPLESHPKKVKLPKKEQISTDSVSVGMAVTILDMEYGEKTTYIIAGDIEPECSGFESVTEKSPVGRALLGHKAGDAVSVLSPCGIKFNFKILNIIVPWCRGNKAYSIYRYSQMRHMACRGGTAERSAERNVNAGEDRHIDHPDRVNDNGRELYFRPVFHQ